VGTAYSFSYTATGYPAPTFAVTAGVLPNGLTLSSAGVISGTPTASTGTFIYTGTVTASNGTSPNATQNFSITMCQAPAITSGLFPTPPNAVFGSAYPTSGVDSYTFTATGYPTPTWSVTHGALPSGLLLNSTTGVISGTPTKAITDNSIIVTATNTINSTQYTSSTNDFSMTSEGISNGPPPGGTVGTNYSFQYTYTGTPTPTYSLATGSLTGSGLTLSSTGLISGTGSSLVAGTYTGSVAATNTYGTATPQAFSITIAA